MASHLFSFANSSHFHIESEVMQVLSIKGDVKKRRMWLCATPSRNGIRERKAGFNRDESALRGLNS